MTQNPYALHEQARKTASDLKYVVVPLVDGKPLPDTFVQANSDELAHGHKPCVYTLPTACELVRNLKASRGWICSYITEVEFHELALKFLADNPRTPATIQTTLPETFQTQTITLIPIDYFNVRCSGRYLVLFNGSIHEARYTHSETAFRLLKDPDSPIPPWKITAYAFLGEP